VKLSKHDGKKWPPKKISSDKKTHVGESSLWNVPGQTTNEEPNKSVQVAKERGEKKKRQKGRYRLICGAIRTHPLMEPRRGGPMQQLEKKKTCGNRAHENEISIQRENSVKKSRTTYGREKKNESQKLKETAAKGVKKKDTSDLSKGHVISTSSRKKGFGSARRGGAQISKILTSVNLSQEEPKERRKRTKIERERFRESSKWRAECDDRWNKNKDEGEKSPPRRVLIMRTRLELGKEGPGLVEELIMVGTLSFSDERRNTSGN